MGGGVQLFGDRVMLREFLVTDEESLHSYASDPAVTRHMAWGPNSIADTRAFLAEAIEQQSDPQRAEFSFAAVSSASNAVVGSGAISVSSTLHRRGELGYVIHPDFWSKGYATEVARLLVQFGFERLNLRRISATCDPANAASARVLQKAGLQYEGRMRSHLRVRGTWRDSLLFATVGMDR